MGKKFQNELTKMPPGTRTAIYNRVSTEKLTQMEAIEHQVEESRRLVLQSGLILVEQYVETESGTSLKGREEYKRMLKDMALNRFDILVAKSQDRMMRNQSEWHLLKNAVRRYHKEIYFYMEDELYNPRENGLKHDVQAMLDEYESEKKSEKAMHSHERRQRTYEGQECLNITRPIFGWDRQTKWDERGHKRIYFIVNEEEAEAIREVCRMVEDGMGFYSIANVMYERGVLSKPTFGTNPQPPKRMDGNTWKKIIRSPLLHGDAVMNQWKKDFYTKERIAVPKEEWIIRENVIPPIVERGYHEYLLSILNGRADRTVRGNTGKEERNGKSIWTGKLYCAECGVHYYGRAVRDRSGQGYRRFYCGNRYRGGSCENIILDDGLLNDAVGRNMKNNFPRLIENKVAELKKALRKLLARMNQDKLGGIKEKDGRERPLQAYEGQKECDEGLRKRQLNRLLDLYLNGGITEEEYTACRERIVSKETEKQKIPEKKKQKQTENREARGKEDRNIKYEEIIKETEEKGLLERTVLMLLTERIERVEVLKSRKIRLFYPSEWNLCGKEKANDNFFLSEEDLTLNRKENMV